MAPECFDHWAARAALPWLASTQKITTIPPCTAEFIMINTATAHLTAAFRSIQSSAFSEMVVSLVMFLLSCLHASLMVVQCRVD